VHKNEEILQEIEQLIATGKPANYEAALQKVSAYKHDHSRSMREIFLAFQQIPGEDREVFFRETGFFQHLVIDGRLNLSGVRLESVPPLIFACKDVRELWLMGNNLKELPPEVRQLESLSKLRLNDNFLKTLPHEICFLKHLYHLELWGNPIESLPEEILQMRNLSTLRLEGTGSELTAIRRFASWGPAVSEEARLSSLNNKVRLLPRKFRRSEVEAHYAFRKT
jgi:hypothetical protein